MAALSVELLCRMGRVKRVACCMMADRGFQLPDHELAWLDAHASDLQVGARYMSAAAAARCSLGHAMSGVYVHSDPHQGERTTLVLFVDPNFDEVKKREKMVSTEQVKTAIALWHAEYEECGLCVLVTPSRLSPDAKKELAGEGAALTLLTHDFLAFPVGRHVLTPPHYALSPEETARFLGARKLDAAQLPQLKAADAVAMYYGFVRGTVVRITRPGGWIVFRVVTA